MPKPFEGLRQRLLEAGVAPSRVARYLRELDDHLEDLVDAALAAGAPVDEARGVAFRRMGGVESLAEAMLAHPEFKSWAARAPWLVLPTGGLLALAGAYILSVLLLVGAVRGLGVMTEGHVMPPGWLPSCSESLFRFDHFVLPVFIGWGIAFAAARQRLAVTWPIISIIAVAVVGAGLVFTADWPVTPRHWSVRISTPLSDPTLSMKWAEYASSVWVTLICMLLPAWFAFRKTGCSPSVEGGRECV